MQLSLDTWDGDQVTFDETPNPGRQWILSNVNQLDSKAHPEVSLERELFRRAGCRESPLHST
jgi:hypothetical protein